MVDSVASRIAKLVWTTSDPGAAKLYGLAPEGSRTWNILMKEYIYLKAGIAYRLVYVAANDNMGSADIVMSNALKELKIAFDTSPDYLTYGGSWEELVDRLSSYRETAHSRDLAGVNLKFLEFLTHQIGASAFIIFDSGSGGTLQDFVKDVEYDLWSKLMQHQKERMGGCGCLSVIACVSMLIVALLAVMAF